MDHQDHNQAERRRRRRKKRQDEESIDSVSTISKIVDEEREREALGVDNLEATKKKKKLKKIKETSKDSQDEEPVKPRRKKKKKRTGSVSSSEENDGEAGVGEGDRRGRRRREREGRKKLSESQSLLKEDFYSDPQLATTLQGLEDDMYSVCGEADTSVLSPYPLIPSIPASQPVAKIYLERAGGFSKTSVSAAVVSSSSSIPASRSPQQSPLALGLSTQRTFRAISTFCHGFLAGLAAWQVFTIYILHKDDMEFVELYSPLSQPLMIVFYLLTIICTVSVCDRYDLAEFSLYHLRKLITFQSGGISILIYWSSLLMTLVTTRLDDKLSLFQHNSSLFEDMKPQELSQEIQTWKVRLGLDCSPDDTFPIIRR